MRTVPQQADIIVFQSTGLFAFWIRQGQRMIALGLWGFLCKALARLILRRPWPEGLAWCLWTHCGVMLDDKRMIQSARVIDIVELSSATSPWKLVPFPGGNRDYVVAFAKSCYGRKYGVLSVISRAIACMTPKAIQIGAQRSGDMDCSTFVSRAWEHGGVILPWPDITQVTPGQIDLAYGGN